MRSVNILQDYAPTPPVYSPVHVSDIKSLFSLWKCLRDGARYAWTWRHKQSGEYLYLNSNFVNVKLYCK